MAIHFDIVLQAVAVTAFMVPWVFYVIYMAASGSAVSNTGSFTNSATGVSYPYKYTTFTYTENTKYAFIYMIFTYYWSSEFIVAAGQIVIALCFSAFYFTRPDCKSRIGNVTILWVRQKYFHSLKC